MTTVRNPHLTAHLEQLASEATGNGQTWRQFAAEQRGGLTYIKILDPAGYRRLVTELKALVKGDGQTVAVVPVVPVVPVATPEVPA